MIFHPLTTRPTDVRSTRFFGGFFSGLFKSGLGFVDVGSGVCVGTPTFIRFDKRGVLLFFASLVCLLFIGFRLAFPVCRMNQISEFHKELLLHRFDALFQLRGLEHRNHQLIVLRL